MTSKLTAPQIDALRTAGYRNITEGEGFTAGTLKALTRRSLLRFTGYLPSIPRDRGRGFRMYEITAEGRDELALVQAAEAARE